MITLVVLAAGMATRYGADKQLEAVGPAGETLMDYAVFDVWRAGCTRVVFVVRDALVASFQRQVLPRWRERMEVELVVQRLDDRMAAPPARLKPWGTAHALLTAAPAVHGDALVCNADDFYGHAALSALHAHLTTPGDAHALAGYRLADTLSPHGGVSRAVCRTDAHGRLLQVEECTGVVTVGASIRDETGRALDPDLNVSMNLWAFRKSMLTRLDSAFRSFVASNADAPNAEFRIPDLVNERIAHGACTVRVIPAEGRWFGMTYAADRAAARSALHTLVAAGTYPRNLFSV